MDSVGWRDAPASHIYSKCNGNAYCEGGPCNLGAGGRGAEILRVGRGRQGRHGWKVPGRENCLC